MTSEHDCDAEDGNSSGPLLNCDMHVLQQSPCCYGAPCTQSILYHTVNYVEETW
jgi:hypothetical protein